MQLCSCSPRAVGPRRQVRAPSAGAAAPAARRPRAATRCLSSKPDKAAKKAKDREDREEQEDSFSDGPDAGPSTQEVAALLHQLTGTTDIAELRLKAGGFQLSVRRDVGGAAEPPRAAPAAAVAVAPQPVLQPALALAPVPYMSADEAPVESLDEAMCYCLAPKVGVFRRGKYAAGKKVGKGNVANAGDTVKKGQTLGYVEQLGTFIEVKAPQGGELSVFKAEEGDPVEYGQALVAIAPYFGLAEPGVTEVR